MSFEPLFGWVPPEEREPEVQEIHEEFLALSQVFGAAAPALSGSGKGKIVLLFESVKSVIGRYLLAKQEIGDCVSHGYADGISTLSCVEIRLRGESEKFVAPIASEWIYGTSRVLQGKGRLKNRDGSIGSWAQEAIKQHGTLIRKDYGSVDLTTYSGERAKDWGYRGLPKDMEPTADEHPVKSTALITSYEDARDSIANGYPVIVCSNVGFEMKRDSEGFCRRKGKWRHCMYFSAVDDAYKRPGLLCQNSFGDYLRGGTRHNQPPGSFWVDAEVADVMLGQDDSYAISDFEGFKERAGELDCRPW